MTTGVVTTIAGSAGDNRIVDGSLSSARFLNPRGVAVADGKIYVCDASTLRVIDINAGTVSTFAGSKDNADNKDGVGANARFGILGGIAYDGGTKLYVTDLYYNVIKTVNLDNFAPVADFTANKTAAVVDEVITLSNTSSGKPATRLKWTITPNSYTVVTGNDTTAPFSIKFTVTGFYSVGLSVTNAYGTDSKQKNSYISVSTTGIKDISETEGLVIYPNPTTAAFNIESLTGNFAMSSVEIMDLNGRMICKRNCSNSLSENIDLTNVPSGLYFVKVYTSNGVKSLRLQKN
jgi:PKD repeat protein